MQNARGLTMKNNHRWLKSAIATSVGALPVLPWQRQTRRRPLAMKATVPAPKPAAVAAS